MKETGIVRRVDELGRIVLPKELRRTLGINERDQLEIFVEGSRIFIQKYEGNCVFCGAIEDLTSFKDKHICGDCLAQLKD